MSENTSGWFPALHRVLVLPEELEIRQGAVYIPEEITLKDEQVQIEGVVIGCGPEVFGDQPNSTVPKIGDTVMFAKLAGFFIKGVDGKRYRMINDLDIVAFKGEKDE